MTNRKWSILENVTIWLLCGILIVATLWVKRTELNDDGYEMDDWEGLHPPCLTLNTGTE